MLNEKTVLLLRRRAILCALLTAEPAQFRVRGPTKLIFRDRCRMGEYFHLYESLRKDEEKFFEYTRMKIETFDKLLQILKPALEPKQKKSNGILPEQMLLVTLRFLATGNSFRSLHFSFRMGVITVSQVVRKTCKAIVVALKQNVRFPDSPEEWLAISADFECRWSFPHVLGCIDGKHVKLKKPPKSGSQYFNYKGGFSTVLMAVCDAKYRFIYYDTGNFGHHHDSRVLKSSSFGKGLLTDEFEFPEDKLLGSTGISVPYFFLGDGGFPLTDRIMKPFAGVTSKENATFNYRLSHARRVIENAFGILCSRWRILLKEIETSAEFADDIVCAAIHLHNFLSEEEPFEHRRADEEERPLQNASMRPRNANKSSSRAKEIREILKSFFNGEGAVSWQDDKIKSF